MPVPHFENNSCLGEQDRPYQQTYSYSIEVASTSSALMTPATKTIHDRGPQVRSLISIRVTRNSTLTNHSEMHDNHLETTCPVTFLKDHSHVLRKVRCSNPRNITSTIVAIFRKLYPFFDQARNVTYAKHISRQTKPSVLYRTHELTL